MTDQQFCLRWNNHQSTLVAVFDGLLEKGVLVDCTLAAEGQQLTAHKVVLAACSPFLETLLSRHYDKHPILILKDVKFSELKAMMDYMYRGEVNISQDQLGTFLKAAESLQIKGLSDGGSDKAADAYTQKRHQERKPLRPTSPLRNSLVDVKRPPPPSYLQNSIRNSLKSSPLLVDIPEDSAVKCSGRDGSISPIPRKKKRPREHHEDPLNNNSIVGKPIADSVVNTSTPEQNHVESRTGEVQTPRVPSPNLHTKQEADPDPEIDDKTDPVAHLKHELIEEEEDINEDSVELTMDEEDCGEAGPSHNDGEFPGDVFGGSQDGDARDGQVTDFNALQLFKEKWQAWQSRANLQSMSKATPNPLNPSWGSKSTVNNNGNAPPIDAAAPTAFGAESPKNVECGRCGRRYKLKSSLRNHQKWECGKEPRFQCPYCVYRAKQKMHVERHIERMHKAQLRAFYDNGNGEQLTNAPLIESNEITLFDKMKDLSGKILVDAMADSIRQT